MLKHDDVATNVFNKIVPDVYICMWPESFITIGPHIYTMCTAPGRRYTVVNIIVDKPQIIKRGYLCPVVSGNPDSTTTSKIMNLTISDVNMVQLPTIIKQVNTAAS